jgi:putative OPT family oligopeptide transporter
LPYPEGVAAAEVLKVGAGSRDLAGGAVAPSAEAVAENKAGLVALVTGSIVSALFAVVVALKVFADAAVAYVRIGAAATGFGFNMSLALIGAGQLIGITVGLAILVGLVISNGIANPIYSSLHPVVGTAAAATAAAHGQVRFIGAGTIGIAAIWALVQLLKPVWIGVSASLAASRKLQNGNITDLPVTERDIPIQYVAGVCALVLLPLATIFAVFLRGGPLGSMLVPLVISGVVYVVIAGFFVAAASGYMAGLIGASNSPVSGLGILAVLGISVLLVIFANAGGASSAGALVAYALVVTAVVLCVATISNDNLQDLKTGQLVGATPWRQQVALVIGVIFGSLVIPPVLEVLNRAYGFAGSANAGAHALPAPQATLISALALGVIKGNIPWGLIGIGVIIGVVIIAIDEILKRSRPGWKLPPIAVGLGIYLPVATTSPAVVGAVAGYIFNQMMTGRPYGEMAKRLSVLVASGLIVGESLWGVLIAGVVYKSGNPEPLAVVGAAFAPYANVLGGIGLFAVTIAIYMWTARLARTSQAPD